MSDNQIRSVLDLLAQSAPAAHTVREGLVTRARVIRQRRAILATGAAVAVGAAVPALWLRDRLTQPAATTASPAAGGLLASPPVEPAARPGTVGIDMHYRPTWLPDELVETDRQAVLPGAAAPAYQERIWSRPPDPSIHNTNTIPPSVKVAMIPGNGSLPTFAPDPAAEKVVVKVHGQRGSALVDGHDVQISWRDPGTGQWLRVSTHEILPGLPTALLVAESVVRADTPAVLESVVAVDWFPYPATGPRVARTLSSVLTGDSFPAVTDRWVHEQFLMNGVQRTKEDLWLSLASAWTPVPGGSPITVRGRSATIQYGDETAGSAHWIQVELDGGVWLYVALGDRYEEGLPTDDLVRVVEGLHIGPYPAPTWIGTR